MAADLTNTAPFDESVWATVKSDFRQATGLRIVAVTLLLAWIAFQWGFGNDAVLPALAAWALDAVDDGETWSAGIAAIGASTLVAFLFWGATQVIDAVVMLTGLRFVPRTAQRVSLFLRSKGWVTAYADMKWSTRWMIAYISGASAICLIDSFATGRPGLKQRRRMIAEATLLSAGSVAGIVGLVAAAAAVARRFPSTERGAEIFIRFAKNPLTWIVIILAVIGLGKLFEKSDDEETIDVSESPDAVQARDAAQGSDARDRRRS